MLRQSKVILGLMAVSIKEFVPEKKHEIVGTHVQKTSKFGKWKIVRPEILKSCQELRPGKQPQGLFSGQPESQAVTGKARRPRVENQDSGQRISQSK